MSALLTCLRCGEEAPDVRMALVDLEAEAMRDRSSIRVVEVELVRQLRHVQEVTRVQAPERFGAEWRCRDRAACEERYRAMTAPAKPMEPPAAVLVDEEAVPWL